MTSDAAPVTKFMSFANADPTPGMKRHGFIDVIMSASKSE